MKTKELKAHKCIFNDGLRSCKCFIAGQKAERKAWLKGLRCRSCGAVKELNMLSSICGKCWKES
jgi:hypothetical protein